MALVLAASLGALNGHLPLPLPGTGMNVQGWVKHFLLAVACFAVLAGNSAMAKGGTNSHEIASPRQDDDPTTSSTSFTGCGRGRYRDARNNRCIGPANLPR